MDTFLKEEILTILSLSQWNEAHGSPPTPAATTYLIPLRVYPISEVTTGVFFCENGGKTWRLFHTPYIMLFSVCLDHVPFWGGIMLTVETQFRRRLVRRLIRVHTVCLQKFLWSMQLKNHQKPLKLEMDSPVQMIRMDKSIGQKRVKSSFFVSYLCLSQHRSNDILKILK